MHNILEVSENGDVYSRIIDYSLIGLITLNVLAIIVESIDAVAANYQPMFDIFELVSVMVFTAEYLLRVWVCIDNADSKFRGSFWGRLRYIVTPMALIDLVVILPFYLSFAIGIDLRVLRILRLLRILKLTR